MEAGTLREKVLIALLIYKFGKHQVNPDVSVIEPEADVLVGGYGVSIKTITLSTPTAVPSFKVSWTVDASAAQAFYDTYNPKVDILLATICKDCEGGLFVIPIEVQNRVLQDIGRSKFLNLPKPGTNPRGVEISREAVSQMLAQPHTKRLSISWRISKSRAELREQSLQQWIELWQQEDEQ